jgi:hypothetical protein
VLFDTNNDFQAEEKKLMDRRTSAVTEIVKAAGFDGVKQFALSVAHPGIVGHILGQLNLVGSDSTMVPNLLIANDSHSLKLVAGYIRSRFFQEGWDTVIEIIEWLQTNEKTKEEDLILVEWAYLQLLDRSVKASPKTLEKRLGTWQGCMRVIPNRKRLAVSKNRSN